jgi:hypothetical protein
MRLDPREATEGGCLFDEIRTAASGVGLQGLSCRNQAPMRGCDVIHFLIRKSQSEFALLKASLQSARTVLVEI